MTDPIFYVVERAPGGSREYGCVIYGKLPDRLTRKGATGLVYACRLDLLPGGIDIAQRPLAVLWKQYLLQRDRGELPNNLSDRGTHHARADAG